MEYGLRNLIISSAVVRSRIIPSGEVLRIAGWRVSEQSLVASSTKKLPLSVE